MSAERRRPDEAWDAIMKIAQEDAIAKEMDRVASLSEEDLDRELAAAGFDPEEVGREGAAFARKLLEMREREAPAAESLAAERARLVRIAARRGKLSRAELEARIARAQRDPRLPAPVAMMFRNRPVGAEAPDDELESILTQLEAHIERAEEEAAKKKKDGDE
jgi:hypothetical protein